MKRASLWLLALILTIACGAVSATEEAPPASLPATAASHAPLTAQMTAVSGSGPSLGGCPLFPADNFWNVPVDRLPVDPHSEAWIDSIGRGEGFHMDFGSGEW